MICVAVIDKNSERRSMIRDWIVSYTINRNCELEMLWFVDRNPASKIEKNASKIQIALISLDDAQGEICGNALYEKNPDCRIIYYCEKSCQLEPLLSSRPISFFLWNNGYQIFKEKFDTVYKEVIFALSTFCYENKSRMYLLPKRNILYFQSDLRYVDIHMYQSENSRILAKLNEIERIAGEGFLRVHKSLLVNTGYILWLDKKNHLIQLANGEQLPVSSTQYEKVCEALALKNKII